MWNLNCLIEKEIFKIYQGFSKVDCHCTCTMNHKYYVSIPNKCLRGCDLLKGFD